MRGRELQTALDQQKADPTNTILRLPPGVATHGWGGLNSTGLLRLGGADVPSGVGILAGLEAKALVVDGAELPQEEEEEEGASDAVEDTVPDHLGGDRDDVAALGEGPADGVGDEHEGQESGRHQIARLESTRSGELGARCVDKKGVPDVEERDAAESIETPLVGAVDKGTNETTDDNEHRHEEGGHDVREGQTGGEENRQEQDWEGDEPLDVPHIPDLTSLAITTEFGRDGGSTEVRGHGEVGERRGSKDDDGELVEEPGTTGTHEVQTDDDQEDESDQGERRPQPVGAIGTDVKLSVGWVEA